MKYTNNYFEIPQTEKQMESFPKPNTIPDGWDTSDMVQNTDTGFDFSHTVDDTTETGNLTWENR